MSERSDADLIEDMLLCITRIKEYVSGLSYEEFAKDYKTQDAVIRNLEIIGEASKKLSDNLKGRHTEIPWKLIAGTRDRLIHGYFGVNIDVIWETVINDIPRVEVQLKGIMRRWFW